MDFSRMPDTVFFQIFKYLSLEDCVRVGHVDKILRRISQVAISRTKSLDLEESRFQNLNADQLAVILNLCSPNLERIKLPNTGNSRLEQLATTLANYRCNRLTDIDLNFAPIGNVEIVRLLGNNPKLESLIWQVPFILFPDMVVNNLKKLKLHYVDDETLQSMTDRCPNLVELDMVTKNVTANVLDQFLASTPQLQKFDVHLVENDFALEKQMVQIWKLPLTSLKVSYTNGKIGGFDFMLKVVMSFPNLKRFSTYLDRPSRHDVDFVAALLELEELRLSLNGPIDDIDEGIRELVMCTKLRKLELPYSVISSTTLVTLLQHCPHLEHMVIAAIDDVEVYEDGEHAAAVLEGLAGLGLGNREITLEFHQMEPDWMEGYTQGIWDNEPVRKAIKKLEENEGLKIKIEFQERGVMYEFEFEHVQAMIQEQNNA